MEQSKVQKIIKNIAFILVLDLILFPLAVALYLFHGFHIVHVVVGFGFLCGLFMVFETANLLYKHVRIVNDPIHAEAQSEHFYDEDDDGPSYRECGEIEIETEEEETIKPEMKQAMDEVFGINKGDK